MTAILTLVLIGDPTPFIHHAILTKKLGAGWCNIQVHKSLPHLGNTVYRPVIADFRGSVSFKAECGYVKFSDYTSLGVCIRPINAENRNQSILFVFENGKLSRISLRGPWSAEEYEALATEIALAIDALFR